MLDKEAGLQELREFADCLSGCAANRLTPTRSYFTFKKHTGQAPGDYRREHSLV